MFTLWRCAEWQLRDWMCLLCNRVALCSHSGLSFPVCCLKCGFSGLVFCYNGSVRDLVYLTEPACSLCTPWVNTLCALTVWEEKGLIVSPQPWMVTGLRLLLLWSHADTLEQIVGALTDSAVELELFSSTVEISVSLRLACIRWRHIRLYLLTSGTWQTRAETAVHLWARVADPRRRARPAENQNLTQ